MFVKINPIGTYLINPYRNQKPIRTNNFQSFRGNDFNSRFNYDRFDASKSNDIKPKKDLSAYDFVENEEDFDSLEYFLCIEEEASRAKTFAKSKLNKLNDKHNKATVLYNGLLLKIIQDKTSDYQNVYDSYDNLIREYEAQVDDYGNLIPKVVYEYDKNGNIVRKAEICFCNSNPEKLRPKRIIEYNCDGQPQNVCNYFYAPDGTLEFTLFKEGIETDDENNQTVSSVWGFSKLLNQKFCAVNVKYDDVLDGIKPKSYDEEAIYSAGGNICEYTRDFKRTGDTEFYKAKLTFKPDFDLFWSVNDMFKNLSFDSNMDIAENDGLMSRVNQIQSVADMLKDDGETVKSKGMACYLKALDIMQESPNHLSYELFGSDGDVIARIETSNGYPSLFSIYQDGKLDTSFTYKNGYVASAFLNSKESNDTSSSKTYAFNAQEHSLSLFSTPNTYFDFYPSGEFHTFMEGQRCSFDPNKSSIIKEKLDLSENGTPKSYYKNFKYD